jgi:hypothetical protein
MTLTPKDDLIAAQQKVQRRFGDCLLLLQDYERRLKRLLAESDLQHTLADPGQAPGDPSADLHRKTLGMLAGELTGSFLMVVNLRRALCQAATVMMHRGRSTWLRTWATQLARRRGAKRAMVALARRIGMILHRMWVDDTAFRSDLVVPHAA